MDGDDTSPLMIESLAEGLSALRGRAVDVQDLVRSPFEGSSSFATERLRVRVDGEWLNVFFKDLNPFHQLIDARNIRDFALERSRREIHVYRNILRGGFLGTPKLYGSRWEPANGLLWLFLEDVGPKRLSRLGDVSLWVGAARWSARFHARVKSLPAEALRRLPVLDTDGYGKMADQLQDSLAKFPAESRGKVQLALRLYRNAISELETLPRGLIHNEYFGKNVVIRPPPAVEPISVIDWETAAIGLSYLDLVSISAGRWTMEQRLQMWRGYFEQAETESGATMDWRSFCDALHSVALHQCIHWLNWWSNGDDVHVKRWLVELERVLGAYGRSDHALTAEAPALGGAAG
jgi:hypothetical protein